MQHLPVYTLDVETRLKVDTIAFESDEVKKTELEILAFPKFRQELEYWITAKTEDMNAPEHSLELHILNRDIEAVMKVMGIFEAQLQIHIDTEEDYNQEIEHELAVYDMCLRYRYALGLYDTDESFTNYYERKMLEFEPYMMYFVPDYTLPSLIFPYDDIPDESRTDYIDTLLNRITKLGEEDSRFFSVDTEINYQLLRLELPTKHDWSSITSGWRFGYMEQRAIQAEIIMHLKNGLREAYLNDYDFEIRKYIDALNLMYHHNLVTSGIEPQFSPIDFPELDYLDASFIQTGIFGGSMYNAANVYSDNVRMLGTRGHGFAAEKANDLIDKALGKDAKVIGDDFAKDGADRIVNGEHIQTKYCASGGKTISECFDGDRFRYVIDGKPMQIEVPKDKYDQALQSMKDRIKNGDMEYLGIIDPAEAENIVRKGHISYRTAQRIAKAGTVEGLTYDAAKGMVTGIQTFGISATITFATAIWRGENADEALNQAVKEGSTIFGRHVMQHVITQQVGRTAIEKSLRPASDYVVKNILGSKTSAQIVNTFFRTAAGQSSIYGSAAMNHLSKLMRGNVVTMVITTAVLSAGSIYDVINGRISGSQLFKNIGTTGASVGGAAIGATVGSVVPVVGTFIGGVVGGIIGGKISKKALDAVIDDDSVNTLALLKKVFVENIEDLQLDRDELNFIANKVFEEKKLSKELKNIYAASSSEDFISNWMDPYIDAILKVRPRIKDIGQLIEAHDASLKSSL